MYTNENKFSFRDIILQFLFVALFIFILLWLFPTKNYVKEVKSELLENTSTEEQQSSVLVTSAIFNQNITTMKEASILYFTTPRLPAKKGDEVKLTLKDMLKEHLLVAPLDEQGNACDVDKSYVILRKDSDEYTLKVNLKCGSEEEYILVHLGCYDYCNGAVCESKTTAKPSYKQPTSSKTPNTPVTPKPTISYQYEYKLNGRWSDWSKWSEWTTTKLTESTSKDVESKTETTKDKVDIVAATPKVTFTCPTGYTLTGTKCVQSNEQILTATIKKVYTCPSGYTYNGGTCKKGYISTVDPTKKVTYTCPSGYSISGTTCYKTSTTTVDATKTIKYSCDDGYVINGTQCTRTVKTVTRQTFTSEKSGSNYALVSVDTRSACTGCALVTYWTYDVTTTSQSTKAASSSVSYSCPSGYDSLGNGRCARTDSTTAAASRTESDLTCPSGYDLKNGKCKKTVIYTVDPDVNISYSCKEGNLVEGVCVKGSVSTIEATKNTTYSCDAGYDLDGMTCRKVTKGITTTYYRFRTRTYTPGDIQWRDTKTDKTLLSKGYYLTGNKRVKSSK